MNKQTMAFIKAMSRLTALTATFEGRPYEPDQQKKVRRRKAIDKRGSRSRLLLNYKLIAVDGKSR